VSGHFAEYVIYPWERGQARNSVAFLDQVLVFDAGDPEDDPSPFLYDFCATSLFGEGLTTADWLRGLGSALAIDPVIDLTVVTQGFTMPATNIPAALVVSTAVDDPVSSAPTEPAADTRPMRLGAVGPNPGHEDVSYSITLAERMPIRVDIYDSLGRLVDTPLDSELEPGTHECQWHPSDARTAPSGTYFLRVSSPVGREMRRVTIVR
jgi:hypothetical protein